MDHSTLYPKELFDLAFKTAKDENILVQAKNAVAGGNNSGAIHLSRGGVKTLAISLPCRYIHSPNSVASVKDMTAVLSLARALKDRLAKGLVE
jgi:endoglucanase